MSSAFGDQGGGENFPLRPDHKDFWDLAEIARSLDAAAHSMPDANDGFSAEVNKDVDSESLTYLAMQRAMRVLGVTTMGQVADHHPDLIRLASVYMEGFVVGSRFRAGRQR